jgi:putative two-component system response regulator
MTDAVKVLIADDEPMMLSLMSSILEARGDCRLSLATNGEEALSKLVIEAPDLLITDLKMPRMGGEDLTAQALSLRPELTVLITTGNGTLDGAVRLMKTGVFDFITKPFLVNDFLASVDKAVQKIRSVPVTRDALAIVRSLMMALETKDPYLKNHSNRVAVLSKNLALAVGLTEEESLVIERAALVHDLGKIGVPEAILHKPGPLTREEFEHIKKHPVYSAEIIRPLKAFVPCIAHVYHHHERLDGTGYPDGLKGNEIPLGARIIAVCDAHDAMASDRPYRPALSPEEIRRNLISARGTHLEGDLVDLFLSKNGGWACA